jgi:hypothetical protein
LNPEVEVEVMKNGEVITAKTVFAILPGQKSFDECFDRTPYLTTTPSSSEK